MRLTRRALGAGAAAALAAGMSRRGGEARLGSERASRPEPITVDGRTYHAYIDAVSKEGQFAYYTCEFDAAWMILKTFGIDGSFEEQLEITGWDQQPEPYLEETADGLVVYGGEVEDAFCGDYTWNYLAKMRAAAMKKVFDAYDLPVTPVRDREGFEDALLRGDLVWLKPTVDFTPFKIATWETPSGKQFPTVVDNDHAVIAIGFNDDFVVIKDPLGPTNTNWERPYEYEVPWDLFLECWAAHDDDALAVGPNTVSAGDGTEGPSPRAGRVGP
jgi:uncharacterized protein YvpB